MRILTYLIVLAISLYSCKDTSKDIQPEGTSFIGKLLYGDFESDSLIVEIDKVIAEEPDNIALLLQKGEALESMRRYNEAIYVYKNALKLYPDDPELLKRCGQRYLSIRNLDLALIDLTKASISHKFIVQDSLTYKENLNWSIWFYLGFTYYLKGEFLEAFDHFEKSYTYQSDVVALLASVNWIHNCLLRLGREAEAQKWVTDIGPGMGYGGNYYKSILIYNGTKTPEETIDFKKAEDFEFCTLGYSIGNWYLAKGEKEKAIALFKQIVELETWQANGFLAAEAELGRLFDIRPK